MERQLHKYLNLWKKKKIIFDKRFNNGITSKLEGYQNLSDIPHLVWLLLPWTYPQPLLPSQQHLKSWPNTTVTCFVTLGRCLHCHVSLSLLECVNDLMKFTKFPGCHHFRLYCCCKDMPG
jgi:hypothetical protein